MRLNSNRLQAFYQVAIDRNFHKAARSIHITQSALSQRILKLEEEMGVTLIIRANDGIALTFAGEQLFAYAQTLIGLEEETLANIAGDEGDNLSGTLRIASYSSILQSGIIPALAPLIRQSPDIHVEFSSREMSVMLAMLKTGEVDFITLDHVVEGSNLEGIQIGVEYLIHVQNIDTPFPDQVFLDHDVYDKTTLDFLRCQQLDGPEIKRCYYDDIYGILTGVRHGLGQAVISRHLVPDDDNIRCINHSRQVTTPVVLYYNKNRYLTRLQKAVVLALKENFKGFLEGCQKENVPWEKVEYPE